MSKKINVRNPSLSITIPAYNEEENLHFVLENTLATAPNYLADYEIVVIDDGSTDKTGDIADAFSKKYRQVRVFHQKNQGYGTTMLRGIQEARKEFVAYMPADGQFLVEDMKKCLPLMSKADLILGFRGNRTDYTLYRHIISGIYLIVLRILFGITYKDVNWLNIWRTKEVQKLQIQSRGIFLLGEIVIRFRKEGLRVLEAPSSYRRRRGGEVKNAKFSLAVEAFFDALKLRFSL